MWTLDRSRRERGHKYFESGGITSVGTKAQMHWSRAVPRSPATLGAGSVS
jgi:hypothetical protein